MPRLRPSPVLRALLLVFVSGVSACEAGPSTDGLLSSPVAEESVRSQEKGRGGVNGHLDYCNNEDAPCLVAPNEGDCDSDLQCTGGVDPVCGKNNGARFGAQPDVDFCWERHCQDRVQNEGETGVDCGGVCGPCGVCFGELGDRDYCSPSCPCASGQGDCDADDECLPGLVCGRGNGARFGGPANFDYCWARTCQNGVRDPGEIHVDCGGRCGPCALDAGVASDGG